ncbi:two-component system regulatory protein YycI [Limosilactobacillus kribbianus]|uniref:two-component system regulatory protein YycI n=1 Tax=Limosilactobacillus kribbianus TaxID=2982695 RepID=UPI00226434C0|nr:two-component system regulatory protein YycI [Limosilactobacillus kribbianus]
MNFKRIQWIFLFAFLVFDLVVAGSLFFQNRFTISNSNPNRQEMVLKEMKVDEISCKPLSNQQKLGYYIAGSRSGENDKLDSQTSKLHDQNYRFSSNTLVSTFDNPIKVDRHHPEQRLNRLVKNAHSIALGKEYHYDAQLSDYNTAVYTQRLAHQALDSTDGQLRFRINSNGAVTGYTQTYLENRRILRPEAPIISQQHAVTWLYKHNLIPNNSQVRWAKLTYTKLLVTNSHDQNVYVPTWVVEVRTKNADTVQHLRVNAFNSTIMKSSPDNVNMSSIDK